MAEMWHDVSSLRRHWPLAYSGKPNGYSNPAVVDAEPGGCAQKAGNAQGRTGRTTPEWADALPIREHDAGIRGVVPGMNHIHDTTALELVRKRLRIDPGHIRRLRNAFYKKHQTAEDALGQLPESALGRF